MSNPVDIILTSEFTNAIANMLYENFRQKIPFKNLRINDRVASLDDAYKIQSQFVERRLASEGGMIGGYKVGLTSQLMQKFCGVDEPIVGRILSESIQPSGACIDPHTFGRLGIECELAVRMRATPPLLAPGEDVGSLIDSICSIHAAFEVIDDRGADYSCLDAASIVAENSWNAGIVVGPASEPYRFGKLDSLEGQYCIDGTHHSQGVSRDVMGGPLQVIAWLGRFLARDGLALQPGQWVMTGSIVATQFPSAGSRLRFGLDGVPGVEAQIMGAR